MRVALDATVVRPPLSGVHYAVRHGAAALAGCGGSAQQWLCLARDAHVRETFAAAPDARVPELPPSLRRPLRRIIWQQLQLPALLRAERAEALLALSYTAPLRCPVPYALQVHDTIALRTPGLCSRGNALHMRALMPGSIRRAAHVLVSTTTEIDHVRGLFDIAAERIHRVPLGVDPLFFADAPAHAGFAALQPYLLFVGNIEPKKGVDTLLAAYARLAAREPELSLVVAGRRAWKTDGLVRQLEGYSGPGRVHRLGYVRRRELPALYAQAAVHMMPSRQEGFGLPVLEAMALGTPVVCSTHPALVETAGGHAVTAPADDATALAAAIVQARNEDDPGRRDARQQWAREHTWQRWADRVAEVTGYVLPTAAGESTGD
jgi:glycosyltransferase involved in cell wall biosynthesis